MCHDEDGLLSHDLSNPNDLEHLVDIRLYERPMGNIGESMGIVRADTAEATRAESYAR